MNKLLKLTGLVALVAIVLLAGCNKVKETEKDTYEADLNAMSNQPETSVTEEDVTTDETNADIQIEGEGIAADYWVEAQDMDLVQGPSGGFDSSRRMILVRNRAFIKCLSGLNLTNSQREDIKMAIKSFIDCRQGNIKEARAQYAKLRESYVDKYKGLLNKLKAGSLTREQFNAAVIQLRRAFLNDLRAEHLKIKLYANLRVCHLQLLRKLHDILSPAQWRTFVDCYKL